MVYYITYYVRENNYRVLEHNGASLEQNPQPSPGVMGPDLWVFSIVKVCS